MAAPAESWMDRHAEGVALTLAVVVGLLCCLGVVWFGIEMLGIGS